MKNTHFYSQLHDRMLLMTSYLVTIASDCHQTLPKCGPRINKQLLKTAWANNNWSGKHREKPYAGLKENCFERHIFRRTLKACLAFPILAPISLSVPSSVLIILPGWQNFPTVSMSLLPRDIGPLTFLSIFVTLVFGTLIFIPNSLATTLGSSVLLHLALCCRY